MPPTHPNARNFDRAELVVIGEEEGEVLQPVKRQHESVHGFVVHFKFVVRVDSLG